MRKALIICCIFIITTFLACGKDRPPTGGQKDIIPPKIIDLEPENLTTKFKKDEIIITFSEVIDEASFKDALNIYPSILKKKISVNKQKACIKFLEELEHDQTYILTIDTHCKDLRDNPLEKIQTLIFSPSDSVSLRNLDVNLLIDKYTPSRKGSYFVKLFSAQDSLHITSQNSEELKKLTFNALPMIEVRVIGFLDENRNSAVDKSRELFDEKTIQLDTKEHSITLTLSLQDTIKPKITNIIKKSTQHLVINLSESIKNVNKIKISRKSDKRALPLYEYYISDSNIECFTEIPDTSEYLLEIRDITDFKENVTLIDSVVFVNRQPPDTTDLEIDSLSHVDGQTISSLLPEFHLKFNKIIPTENLSISLINSENNQYVDLNIEKINGYIFSIKPKNKLRNYVPYSLIISKECSDYEGNTLQEEIFLSILPIIYK